MYGVKARNCMLVVIRNININYDLKNYTYLNSTIQSYVTTATPKNNNDIEFGERDGNNGFAWLSNDPQNEYTLGV